MTDDQAYQRLRGMDSATLGRFGESLWSNIFRASRIPYIPLSKIETGFAPLLSGPNVILPDFELIGEGWAAYVDSKAKQRSVVFRKTGQERHGIDRRNFEHYQRMALLGRKDCALAICELWSDATNSWSGALLIETLRELSYPISGMSNQAHMVYWPRKRFVDLDSCGPLELLEIANGCRDCDLSQFLDRVFAGAKPEAKQSVLFG